MPHGAVDSSPTPRRQKSIGHVPYRKVSRLGYILTHVWGRYSARLSALNSELDQSAAFQNVQMGIGATFLPPYGPGVQYAPGYYPSAYPPFWNDIAARAPSVWNAPPQANPELTPTRSELRTFSDIAMLSSSAGLNKAQTWLDPRAFRRRSGLVLAGKYGGDGTRVA